MFNRTLLSVHINMNINKELSIQIQRNQIVKYQQLSMHVNGTFFILIFTLPEIVTKLKNFFESLFCVLHHKT